MKPRHIPAATIGTALLALMISERGLGADAPAATPADGTRLVGTVRVPSFEIPQ